LLAVSTVWVWLASCGISRAVLGSAVITDDEHVYQFIAETLRTGSLTAPSPREDLEFFIEQFVVLSDTARYGKYPLGHPALLALGQMLQIERLIVPLVSALLIPLTYWIGARIFDRRVATLTVLLLCGSPQLLMTGATLLSQPSSALFFLIALVFFLRETRSRSLMLCLSGLAMGLAVLVRPLPQVLFAATMALALLRAQDMPWRANTRAALLRLLAFVAPLVALSSLLLLINAVQSGHPLKSGYVQFHAAGQAGVAQIATGLGGSLASQAMSLVAGGLRLNIWLLGWPLSLIGLIWARPSRASEVLWGSVLASLAYRLLSPKAGVAATGPIYLYEIVPVLCLLSASGILALAERLRARDPWSSAVTSGVVAASIVSLTLFWPVKLSELRSMGAAQNLLSDMMAAERVTKPALLFHEGIVPYWSGLSWAYYPPCNSPALDNDILYIYFRRDPEGLAKNLEFWRRRFPDRSAWFFTFTPKGPVLMPLASYVEQQLGVPVGGGAPIGTR
jgi:hypothetical protein